VTEHRDEVRIEPVASGGVSRVVPVLTFVVGIFLGAAVVKPWDLLFPPSQASVASAPATASSSSIPTRAASQSHPPAECAFVGGWRVFALGQPDPLGGDGSTGKVLSSDAPISFGDIGNPLRRWLEVDPLETSTGPGDVRVPFVTIVSDRIGGIGFCPPQGSTDGPPVGARFDGWSLDPAGTPTAMPMRPVRLGAATSIEVPLFIGSDPSVSPNERWAPGRYVFAVEASATGYERWFGVEIRTPPGKLSDVGGPWTSG
jgi:hypothetical protein